MAEALPANIDRVAVFEEHASLYSKVAGRRELSPLTICIRLDRPVNALQRCFWKFSHKERL